MPCVIEPEVGIVARGSTVRAYETSAQVTPEGRLEVPKSVLDSLPRGETLRLIVLVTEAAGAGESAEWSRLTSEQFLAGYADADSIYDAVE